MWVIKNLLLNNSISWVSERYIELLIKKKVSKIKKKGRNINLSLTKENEISDKTKYNESKIIINNDDIIVKLFEKLYTLFEHISILTIIITKRWV